MKIFFLCGMFSLLTSCTQLITENVPADLGLKNEFTHHKPVAKEDSLAIRNSSKEIIDQIDENASQMREREISFPSIFDIFTRLYRY